MPVSRFGPEISFYSCSPTPATLIPCQQTWDMNHEPWRKLHLNHVRFTTPGLLQRALYFYRARFQRIAFLWVGHLLGQKAGGTHAKSLQDNCASVFCVLTNHYNHIMECIRFFSWLMYWSWFEHGYFLGNTSLRLGHLFCNIGLHRPRFERKPGLHWARILWQIEGPLTPDQATFSRSKARWTHNW